MFNHWISYLPLLVSVIAGLALVPLCIKLAFALDIIDDPAHRKIHAKTTPYLGGLAVIAAMTIGVIASVGAWPDFDSNAMQKLVAISLSTLAATLLGVLDDKFHLAPRFKLGGQLLIAIAFALFAYRFELLQLPTVIVEIHTLSVPLTVFWMLAMINAFNMVDGMDGLAGSVALSAMGMLIIFAAYFHDSAVGLMGMAGFGAVAAFLFFNWSPARIFLGDAGSLGLGTFFATALLATGNQGLFGLPDLTTPSTELPVVPFKILSVTLVIIYPALEVLFSVLRRMLRGKPVSSADKGHIHHRLLARGWRPGWICLAVVLISSLAQGVVMAAMVRNLGLAAWLLGTFGVTLGLSMHYLGLFEVMNPLVTRYFRPHYLIANHLIAMQQLKLTLTRSGTQVLSLVNATCRELGVLRYRLTYNATLTNSTVERDWYNPDEAVALLPDKQGIRLAGPVEGFSDQIRLPLSGASATWTFKAVEREEELDVEYRVLMSSFMQDALDRLTKVPPQSEEDSRRKSAVLDIGVSAAKLREVHGGDETPVAPPLPLPARPSQTAKTLEPHTPGEPS
ncbi:MAG TPA: MraY family glycosyltransferase [Planctomycetota bacterium]|nr:MraY family glycosyltransferase [Planctomycetota bacterium]